MNRRNVTSIGALVLVLSMSMVVAGCHSAKEGFYGYEWGTPLAKMEKPLGLTLKDNDGRIATYKCKPIDLNGIEVIPTLAFYDGEFGAAAMTFPEHEKEAIEQYLKATYGAPTRDAGGYSGVYWIGENTPTIVSLTCMFGSDEWAASVNSRSLMNRLKETWGADSLSSGARLSE